MTAPLQGPTGQNPINQIEQTQTTPVNTSGVKENNPPMLQKAVNTLKGGFNNLVLSHNKRVVKRAYVKQKVEKTLNSLVVMVGLRPIFAYFKKEIIKKISLQILIQKL